MLFDSLKAADLILSDSSASIPRIVIVFISVFSYIEIELCLQSDKKIDDRPGIPPWTKNVEKGICPICHKTRL